MTFVRAYLRASTDDQDANRAKAALEAFATEKGQKIASYYVENVSGAKLVRPELMRLLEDAQRGDVLLIEQVDRLSRLTNSEWEVLKARIASKGLNIVSLDLPTSHAMIGAGAADDFTARMLSAVNGMLLDMLAAVARKDYEDRRRRQKEGVETAKSAGKYAGRKADTGRHEQIAKLLETHSWSEIQDVMKCSRATVATVARVLKSADGQKE